MVDLLDSKQYQEIKINDQIFLVINKVKYNEKSSFWYEYKIAKKDTKEEYHLNVELSNKAILYIELNENMETNTTKINFRNKTYSLFETGRGNVKICFGTCDLAMNEEVRYYEYLCDTDENEIISIEKWRQHEEISIGHKVDISSIT
ncbi:MAG: DUF4178 domain-containing protein [Clostridia bacterium]|nr:DUF4178 domain-containing protein [Clostridia bacterium]